MMIRTLIPALLLGAWGLTVQAQDWENLSQDSQIELTRQSLNRLLTNPEQNAIAIRNHAMQLETLLGQCFSWGGELSRLDTSLLSSESVFGLPASEIHHDTLEEELDANSDSFFLPGWEESMLDPVKRYEARPGDAAFGTPKAQTNSEAERHRIENELKILENTPSHRTEAAKYKEHLESSGAGLAAPPVNTLNLRAEQERRINNTIELKKSELRTLMPTDPLYPQRAAELRDLERQRMNNLSKVTP